MLTSINIQTAWRVIVAQKLRLSVMLYRKMVRPELLSSNAEAN